MSTQSDKTFKYFVRSDYAAFIQQMQRFANSPEPSVVICPPYSGIITRIEQLIQDHARDFKHPLVQIELGPSVEYVTNIETTIGFRGYTYEDRLTLLITNSDYCLRSKNTALLRQIAKWNVLGRWNVVFFFESDIASAVNRELLGSTHFYARQYYYPLFDSIEAERFLQYLADAWHMPKLSKRVVTRITRLCGGQIWLLKHALRELHSNPTIDVNKLADLPGIQFRLDHIAQAHPPAEIAALMGKPSDPSTRKHLEKLGLLDNNKCTIPLLHDYLLQMVGSKGLTIRHGEIHCEDISLKHSFTPQESGVLRLLIAHKGKKVSRDDIANVLWGDDADEKYSIWAIEQLIKRLRRKLVEIGLHQTYIKTLRGTGYTI